MQDRDPTQAHFLECEPMIAEPTGPPCPPMPLDPALPILLVEDEALTMDLFAAMLTAAGFNNVDRATDGLDAWTKLRHRRYGLVISDYAMRPMDGLRLLQALRDDDDLKHTPFLLVSAVSHSSIEAAAEVAGADAFMPKPFTPGRLQEQIRAIC